MPAIIPTRKEALGSGNNRDITLGLSGINPSTIANLVSGNSSATVDMASVNKNPTPTITS
ncbi:hypothetical protein ES707_09490 [subsurface metagenome]